MLVSLNINPIAMGATLIVDSGIVGKFSNLGKNLMYLAGKNIESVSATGLPSITPPAITPTTPSGPVDVNVVGTPSDYFGTTQSHLDWIRTYMSTLGNTEDANSLWSILYDLYELGSSYSQNVKIDADSPEYRNYGKSIAVHDEAMTARLLGVNERDLSHVNAAQIEQLMQMGYDPRWINENGTIEEDFDKLIRATHEYAVANVYSLNNMIGGALWRPYSDEIPYIREFAEIVGGFANVYMGYWDTNVSTLKQPINSQRALEILGYDAILRYEGIQVLEPTKILENGVEAIFVPDVVGLQKYTESPVDRTIVDDPDTHEEDIPDRNIGPNGIGGVPTGQSGINENIILRQVEVAADGSKAYVPEDDIQSAIIPDSQIVQLYQEEIPNQDITWLDAVTVLYKALGQEQISYQTFTAYNPNLTPETSPLSKDLPGLTSFDGYNFYAFFTRSNPYSGDLETGSFQAIYWRKAINDGFVSYALRDEPISAEDFYMLAKRMMVAYGEPEMSPDEMHTLLQIYGSYYPVQLGRTVADSWEYLKCRGILTDENTPESFTSNMTRDQLLDICMRIKDVDSRITYKNMNLVIDVGEILRDKDYFPVYDFELKTEEDDEFAFISTTIEYTSYDYYTYMFPVERAVNLGYSGCGLVYNKPEKSDENLIEGALYEGKKHIEGYDYYIIDVPKDYTGEIYLGFNNYDDPDSVNGTVDFIEVPNYCLGGGIYTAYEITEQGENSIATLVKPEAGVSYFPFRSQSNNIELVYYCDFDRCGEDRPLGGASASIAGFWDSVVDKWNYLTQPTEVLAAEFDEDLILDQIQNGATLTTRVSVNSDFWKEADAIYGSGQTQIPLTNDGTDAKQAAPNAPGWFSALTRAAILSKAGYAVWGNYTQDEPIQLSTPGKIVNDIRANQGGTNYGNIGSDIGANIVYATTGAGKGNWAGLYNEMVNKCNGAIGRRNLIAFAAGIKPSDVGDIIDPGLESGKLPEAVSNAILTLNSYNVGWINSVSSFNKVTSWDADKGYYTKSIRTTYASKAEGDAFEIYSRGLTAEEILDRLGNANQSGNESGITARSITNVAEISTSLNTSVIMGKDEQVLLCWEDLVKAGFAWGITDGRPKHSDKDGTYTFMTKNGMVKVNDTYHLIQIGSTLYTWPDDKNAPNLVYVDNDRNMYIDIRCVTGIINVPVTAMDDKTEIFEQAFGTGNYAVYSISTKGANTSLYKTKTVSCYNFPETTLTCGDADVHPVPMNVLDVTSFDTLDTGAGDIYWDGVDLDRILLADFNPTSNWLLTVTEEEGDYLGKVYVYYLKDAMLKGTVYSDGESAPEPEDVWKNYWIDQIDVQKKRCDVNFGAVVRDIRAFMESYRTQFSADDLWIADMTEAALYSIAADTGTFYISSDYAIRCFDVTVNNIPSQNMNSDFTESVDATEEFRSNEAGTVYFMDYAGYVYNVPDFEDFTLAKYFSGEYVLPIVSKDGRELWNMNMTWYGNHGTEKIPYGLELTSDGYINYKDFSVKIPASDLPERATDGGSNDTSLPFYSVPSGEQGGITTFKPAPTAIFARYGILDSTISEVSVGVISQNETKRNYYYIGNRTVQISDDFASRDAGSIPFDFASTKYNPISLPSATAAHFLGQVRTPISRSYYSLPYAKIHKVESALRNMEDEEHLATDESYLWDGKAKLVSILNMIDRSTNWLMWATFVLAPMICVIVMTLLIGLSFITDNKIYQSFCEKFFDPVSFLTLRMKDSQHWRWRDVWRRATITYIAFALFANANILKLVIWAVDGWMRITEALGF